MKDYLHRPFADEETTSPQPASLSTMLALALAVPIIFWILTYPVIALIGIASGVLGIVLIRISLPTLATRIPGGFATITIPWFGKVKIVVKPQPKR